MPPGLPPMSAGIFGYLGYDMVRRMERLAPAKPDPIGVPEALLIRPTVMVVFDGGARRDFDRDPGPPGAGGFGPRRLRERHGAARRGGRRARIAARSHGRHGRRSAASRRAKRGRTRPRTSTRRWSSGPRTISAPATSSRSCCRSASRAASTCRPSRSTGRCGGSIRRPFSASSISAASRSSAPAPKSWCACATARW